MANTTETIPNFLRDAFEDYAQFTAAQKQDAQKRALKWLQSHIQSELSEQKIFEQFVQKWRSGTAEPSGSDNSPLYLENLPRSYKGSKSINQDQDKALTFLQEQVPPEMQSEFKARWDVKTALKVSNKKGTSFKIDEKETSLYSVEYEQVYYVLSYEEKGEDYLVILSEDISPQNQNTWLVSQKDVQISNI